MTNCELCGKQSELFLAKVEGTQLKICENCSKYGKVIKKIEEPSKKTKKSQATFSEPKEPVFLINEDYNKLIKEKREELNLSHEQLADKLNEKTSIIASLESKKLEPSIKLANKIEKFLNITLVEEYQEEKTKLSKQESKEFTIGDMIKVKK